MLLTLPNEGDVVLDPFCGCRTTIAAAQKLGRTWIGIDVTHLAVGLMKLRLKDSFGMLPVAILLSSTIWSRSAVGLGRGIENVKLSRNACYPIATKIPSRLWTMGRDVG